MVQINFALKEVNCKVVYYGPGMSGKTTNLEVIHKKAPKERKGELTSIATEGDRTLFFDFMPLDLGKVAGMNTKFQLYTVPGQIYYNSTRKLVLQGADGVIFVADSQEGKMVENLESLQNLEENLRDYGMDIRSMPLVIQYNKMDMPNIMDVDFMEEKINIYKVPTFPAVAVTGKGVFPALKKLTSMVLESLNKQHGPGGLPTAAGRRKPRSSGRVPTPPPAAPTAGPTSASPPAPQAPPRPMMPSPPAPAMAPGGGQQQPPRPAPAPAQARPMAPPKASAPAPAPAPPRAAPKPPAAAPKPKATPMPKGPSMPKGPAQKRGPGGPQKGSMPRGKGGKNQFQMANAPKDNTKILMIMVIVMILFFLAATVAVLYVTGMFRTILG